MKKRKPPSSSRVSGGLGVDDAIAAAEEEDKDKLTAADDTNDADTADEDEDNVADEELDDVVVAVEEDDDKEEALLTAFEEEVLEEGACDALSTEVEALSFTTDDTTVAITALLAATPRFCNLLSTNNSRRITKAASTFTAFLAEHSKKAIPSSPARASPSLRVTTRSILSLLQPSSMYLASV
jgi:hypothetical protein